MHPFTIRRIHIPKCTLLLLLHTPFVYIPKCTLDCDHQERKVFGMVVGVWVCYQLSKIIFFCNESPETIVHVFCECDKVKPIWKDLLDLINNKLHENYSFDGFDLMFGVEDDVFFSFLILCCKYYIYKCRFQKLGPNFAALKNSFWLSIVLNTILLVKKEN